MHRRPLGISRPLAVALVLFQLACPIAIAAQGSRLSAQVPGAPTDAANYRTIALQHGTPYRDFEVEYPPLALGLFHAVGIQTYDGFRVRLFALQALCQALIVFLLFRFWSSRAGWSYVLLSAPMLFIVYQEFDLVVVALAVSGATLVRRGRPIAGALGFVIGSFTKVWPVVLLPGLLAARKVRSFVIGAASGVAGLVAWGAWGGSAGIGQVLGYRGARGWEFESLPGSLLRASTRDAFRFESGAWRLGAPPRVFSFALTAAMIGSVALVWWLASQRPALPEGLAETAAITSLLVFGTLLSPQFVIWPLPFAAIAVGGGFERIGRWAFAVAALTLLDRILFDPARPMLLRSELAVIGRNVALAGLLMVAFIEIRKVATARVAPVVA